MSKFQEACSILRLTFALSKWPHFHRAYLVTIRRPGSITLQLQIKLEAPPSSDELLNQKLDLPIEAPVIPETEPESEVGVTSLISDT